MSGGLGGSVYLRRIWICRRQVVGMWKCRRQAVGMWKCRRQAFGM